MDALPDDRYITADIMIPDASALKISFFEILTLESTVTIMARNIFNDQPIIVTTFSKLANAAS